MMIAGPMGKCGEIAYTLTCGCLKKDSSGRGPGNTAVVPISLEQEDRANKAWKVPEEEKKTQPGQEENQENWEI